MDADPMHKATYHAAGQDIVNDILHPDPLGRFLEEVLMMPKTVGSQALFIDKENRFPDMGNF